MNTTPPQITQLEMSEAEIELAEKAARRLGYEQTAYTSTSAIWGLFCLPENPAKRSGQVIRGGVFFKTAEFGIVFLQDLEDLHCNDLIVQERSAAV